MGKPVWKQGEDEFSIYVEDADGHIIADVRAPRPPVPANVEDAMEHHRRRARMLAAAPDMLAMLKEVRDYYLDRIAANSIQSLLSIIERAEGTFQGD